MAYEFQSNKRHVEVHSPISNEAADCVTLQKGCMDHTRLINLTVVLTFPSRKKNNPISNLFLQERRVIKDHLDHEGQKDQGDQKANLVTIVTTFIGIPANLA